MDSRAVAEIVDSVALCPDEIRRFWAVNRDDAERRGTYVHFFEAYLNGYVVPQVSPEFSMFQSFLEGMQGWRDYRAEWIIFAEEENIAGSIDLRAVNQNDGDLALIDWKRISALESKYVSPCAMLPPLDHIPDCAGWRCRPQVNLYKYIIEKYYAFTVSEMLVVCAHPDRQLQPFIVRVPHLDAGVGKHYEPLAREGCRSRKEK